MTRYAFCLSLLFCGCIVFQSPLGTIKATTPVEQQEQMTRASTVQNFFTCKAGSISLDALLAALNALCPGVFEKIIAQSLPNNSIIAEEVVVLIRNNGMLLPVDLQTFLNGKQNWELVVVIKEVQAFAELKNFVDEKPRWIILQWPDMVDKLVALLKDNPKPEYKGLVETIRGLKESGSWGIKFKLLKHLSILPDEIRAAGLAGLNRGLKAAGK